MSTNQPNFRVGVDIGGTFTDFVFIDESTGETFLEKTPTTPRNLWEAIAKGLEKGNIDLLNVSMLIHGTTIGLNAFLEKKGKKTGLITTKGFRDVYEIGRHNRVDMYDLFYKKPEPLIPREFRLEVAERLDAQGNVLVPLCEEDVLNCIKVFKRAGIESVAICLLHSYANPEHEIKVGEILDREFPEAAVSLSHTLAREWREYERTSTTAINAYIMPIVGSYLSKIEEELAARGYRRHFYVNKSSGGIMTVEAAKIKPVHTIMSGPSGGAVSAAYIGKVAGFDHVISFDMGGTSTDVAITYDGKTRVTVDSKIERHPIMVPMVDVHSIGAGGGSIAWLNEAGALNVGPQSAGAEPGPVCYQRGGTEPTVTDANLVLGRLDLNYSLGGEITMDVTAARQAIEEKVAKPLRLSVEQAAAGIISVVNTKMAYAIRAITVERGLDPKDFVLLGFGGAGPMHVCALAKELGIPRVIVPVAPGAFSALGMLLSDVRHDYVRTFLAKWDEVDQATLEGLFDSMMEEAKQAMEEEKDAYQQVIISRSVDMRYIGQEYTVNIPVPDGELTPEIRAELRATFDQLHNRTYGHSSETEPTEIINARLTVFGLVPKINFAEIPAGDETPAAEAIRGKLSTYFEENGKFAECPVYERESLLANNRIAGPAIIREKGATTVLPPGYLLEVTKHGNLLITERS
ncbi:MAG: hydantoinase/oxoprolinase family protein [Bacillota bacterium]